jgi:hypothetical protein
MSATKEKKLTFKATVGEQEVELAITDPTWQEQLEAQDKYNETFFRSSKTAMLRPKLDEFLRTQGVWTPEKEAELTTLEKELDETIYSMVKGNIKLSDLLKLHLRVRELRIEINRIANIKEQYISTTAESQAENMRFACLVSSATVYNDTGKRYWPTTEAYLIEAGSEVANLAANKYAAAAVGAGENPQAERTENKILIKYGLMDKKCRYIDSNKKPYSYAYLDNTWKKLLVDDEGNWVNEKGQYVDDEGRLIDKKGRFVEEEGTVFYDDEGNVVTPVAIE